MENTLSPSSGWTWRPPACVGLGIDIVPQALSPDGVRLTVDNLVLCQAVDPFLTQ